MSSDQLLQTLCDRWPGSCAVALVGASGVIWSAGDLDAPFALASVTKALVATAVLVAVEEGSVDLDDAAGPPGSTLRHLLSHASGLAPDANTAMAPVGTRRIYSNSGFEALGDHLTRATELTVAEYLLEGVFRPLDMGRSALIGSAARDAVSTCGDLTRWVGELLVPGRLLDGATVRSARSAQFPELDGVLPGYGQQHPNPWGLGWEVRGVKQPHWTGGANSAATFGHFGQSGTFVWIDPDLGVGLIGLGDVAFGPWAVELWPVLSDTVIEHITD